MTKPPQLTEELPAKSAPLKTRACKFDELRLSVDHRLQIEAGHSAEPIHGRLLGYLKGATLIVKLPTTQPGGGVALSEGDSVLVRGFSGRIAFVFSSEVEKIRYTPYPYCHLRFPTAIRGADVRKEIRARCNLPAKVVNVRLGNDDAMEATISDISAAGALLSSSMPLGGIGDNLALSFRFWIQPNDYEVNLHSGAVIQTSAQGDDDSRPEWLCGVRFEGIRSTENILLQNLIYQLLQNSPGTRI